MTRRSDLPAVEIAGAGMVTAVGLSAAASAAAIRAGISRVQETRFVLGEDPVHGATVPLDFPDSSADKLLRMACMAVQECLEAGGEPRDPMVPILLCLPEPERPGRPEGLDAELLPRIRGALGLLPGSMPRGTVSHGRAGGVLGLAEARRRIASGAASCVVVGVDTFLTAETLTSCRERERLKTPDNPDGFIPGEAAAAVLVRRATGDEGALRVLGIGVGIDPAPIGSGEPQRAEGLFRAIREAFATGGCSSRDVDYRITDVNGERYGFKDAGLALTRTLREPRERLDHWHPVECIGEVGAAIAPVILGVALAAARRGYAPGPGVLCHVSSDGADRGAVVLSGAPRR